MFIDGAVASSLSYNSIISAIPPWHVHVTKSPGLRLCLGAFLKKSFTRSWYPTLYISGKIFRCGFLNLEILGGIENVSDPHVRYMSIPET